MGAVGQVNTGGWDQRRLLVVLGGVVAAAVGLLLGLGYAVYFAFTSPATSSDQPASNGMAATSAAATGMATDRHPSRSPDGAARRGEIAAAPMLAVRPADGRATPPAAVAGPTITIPVATVVGPASVPAGFAHTPEGAIGQLAAIEITVLSGMSIAAANDVYAQWALPGGVGVGGWEITQDVQAFLGAARMGAEKDPSTTVVATPVGAQVKGTDGPDWVLACVLLHIRATVMRATIVADAAMGYGYCEPMQWHGGRWMIAAGPPAAKAPSTWPGSDLASKAGWRTWVGGEQQ